ncbi:MAG TPA: metallophosphoesterase [Planctomycetota bacterium]|nr:metallophosphoesterase [Planctomycetota bacterium]
MTGRRWIAILFILLAPPALTAQDVWTGVERVVAVGDVHGDHDQLVATLRSAGIIDAAGDWSGGKAHLVQTGDVLDRGPDSRKAMDLLMKLEAQALEAGGRVHCLIGNHEAMVLYGDYRYLSEGEIAAFRDENSEKAREELYAAHRKALEDAPPPGGVPRFDDAYRRQWEAGHPLGLAELQRAFGPSGTYGRWIRRHNAVVRIDGSLFLHGGISPKYAQWPIRKINEQVRSELADFTKLKGGIVEDDEGPLWYRGLALDDGPALEAHLREILATHQCDRIVIGHTITGTTIASRFGGRVLMIDVGMSRFYDPAGKVACLRLDRGRPSALHRGRSLELPRDDGLDLLRYLKEAAALDPPPSPLRPAIERLEARLLEPSRK